MIGNIIFMCTGLLGWCYGYYLGKRGQINWAITLTTLNGMSFILSFFSLMQSIK